MPGLIFGIFFWTITTVTAIAYIDQPSNKSVTIGNDVVLRCTVSNKGGSKLYWQKLDDSGYKFISMDGNIDPYGIYSRDIKSRYSVVGDHNLGEYNLKIERVKLDDSGKYVCVYFESGYGRYSRIATVSIMWPAPEPPQCQVTYSSSSRRVSLICLSRGGHPLASLAWKNGNMNLKGTARKTNDVSLNIYQPSSQTSFTGSTFTCVATTPALDIPRTCTVLPVYINSQRNQLYGGDDVILTCEVFSNEKDLAISWQINHEQVANSGKLTEFKDGKRKLVIYDVDITDTEMKVTCIVRNRNGLAGNATETLIIKNKESAVYVTTHPTTIRTTLNNFQDEITKTAQTSTGVKLPTNNDIITVSTGSIATLQRHLTDGSNFSAIGGTVIYGGPFPGPPFEVGGGGKSPLFYKIFLSAVSIVTFLLFILVIAYAMRYHRARALSQLVNRRQLEDKCKDSVTMTGVLSDMASESKRSDNDDSGISYGTEIESNIDCNTIEYKQNKCIIGTYPDLIISQDTNIRPIDEKNVEPIYMSLNNCSDEESEDEIKDQKVTNLHPVYMMLDREAEKRDEVYSCVDIRPRNFNNQTQLPNDIENNTDINTQKHLYAVLEDDSEKSLIVSTRSDLRECEFSSSGYFSGESPCEYEELPDGLPDRKTQNPDPSCAYAVTDLRQIRRPLRPSLKQTLWRKLTRNNSRSNTLKDGEHISRRSLPKPSRSRGIKCDNTHALLTKTSSCPLVPMGTENTRTTPMDSPSQFRNSHFMANRPLISRPIFGRTVSTERGIVVTDDYAELEMNPSFSECQTDDRTYESLEEYAVVKRSPTKPKLKRANEDTPGLKLSPYFHGRNLPKIRKSASCHRCGSPNGDRGFFSSSSEEEVGTIGPQTPPRILKNYKRIDQIRKDEARLKRASWPNRMSPKTEKRRGNFNIYNSVVDVD